VRIDAQSLVGGYPALQMRKLVRTLNDRLYWGLEVVQSFLHTSEIDASRVVAALEAHGLARARRGKGAKAWTTTQLAQSLACATAAKPITRRTAEAALAAFLERVQRVNRDDLFLAKVTRVIVFGSYLQKDLARLGDVDIAVELEAKALRGCLVEQFATFDSGAINAPVGARVIRNHAADSAARANGANL
jgi:hypothetical protein